MALLKRTMHVFKDNTIEEKSLYTRSISRERIILNCIYDDVAKKYKIDDKLLLFCNSVIQSLEIMELRWYEDIDAFLEIEQYDNILPDAKSYDDVRHFLKNKYPDNTIIYENGILSIEAKIINIYKKI